MSVCAVSSCTIKQFAVFFADRCDSCRSVRHRVTEPIKAGLSSCRSRWGRAVYNEIRRHFRQSVDISASFRCRNIATVRGDDCRCVKQRSAGIGRLTSTTCSSRRRCGRADVLLQRDLQVSNRRANKQNRLLLEYLVRWITLQDVSDRHRLRQRELLYRGCSGRRY